MQFKFVKDKKHYLFQFLLNAVDRGLEGRIKEFYFLNLYLEGLNKEGFT